MPGLRRKTFRIGDTAWPMLFGAGPLSWRATTPLPADAKAVGCEKGPYYTAVTVESAEFDEVPEGSPIPVVEMWITDVAVP